MNGNDTNTNKTSDGQTSGNSKRSKPVFISLTACSKPSSYKDDSDDARKLPKLEIYVSISDSLQKPGPGHGNSNQTNHETEEGYVSTTVEAEGDVYIGVTAHNSTEYSGSYSYELAASVDGFFHSFVDDSEFLYLLDSDMNSALFTTDNLTEAELDSQNYSHWMNMTPPYTMFANNVNDTAVAGLQRSYCALDQLAQIGKGDSNIKTSMTTRGPGDKPKEQFYVTGLNQSSAYIGIVALDGNSTSSGNDIIGGGGRVWKAMNFSTKAGDSPIRRNKARNAGQEFINGTSFGGNHTLRQDPATNRSRMSLIDDKIRPGPYKEILPCEDTCYNLVKSCPASLSFSCPQGRWLDSTYGKRDPNRITCSWLGAAYFMGGGNKISSPMWSPLFALAAAWLSYWTHRA
ncbi:Mg(2+) transporter [Aspergillus hancockii]|nr:Mg(2+) transporter [Aspergillus hancockii]